MDLCDILASSQTARVKGGLPALAKPSEFLFGIREMFSVGRVEGV